jgi:RNA polymerase sigma factor (sigma-70 family)
VLRNRDDAADAVQEVFLRAVNSLKEASSEEEARSWLLTEAREYCRDVLQRGQPLDRTGLTVEVESGGGIDPEAAAIDRHVVTAILGELRGHERRALWQWAVERRPLTEIADDQGRSYKAVQQFLIRVRRHALSVAARVAALLGLVQVGRSARRVTQASQLVLVAVAVPVVLASVPASNAIHRDHAPVAPPSQSVLVSPAPAPAGKRLEGSELSAGVAAAPRVGVGGLAGSVPSVALDGATSTVDSAISTLERSVRRLRQNLGTTPALNGELPVNVGLPPTPAPTSLLP